jgi:hypothetical protein
MDAYLVSHNGLGDNLFMVGAVNFIKQFYKNVYFLCKHKYYENVRLFFDDKSNIICVPLGVNENDEIANIKEILDYDKYMNKNIDILVCGAHKSYLNSKITNIDFLNYPKINKNYTIDYYPITGNGLFSFVENFYKDINLNLTHCYEYFYLAENDISKQLFNSVSHYYLVFIQSMCSNGTSLNISNLTKKYINDDKVLLVCSDTNLYNKDNEKHDIAQKFVFNNLVNYVDIIKNSDEIYLIDSCFLSIVLPFLKTNQLKTNDVRIILRSDIDKYIL